MPPGRLQEYFNTSNEIRMMRVIEMTFLVVISRYSKEQDRQRSKAAGFDAHRAKPQISIFYTNGGGLNSHGPTALSRGEKFHQCFKAHCEFIHLRLHHVEQLRLSLCVPIGQAENFHQHPKRREWRTQIVDR